MGAVSSANASSRASPAPGSNPKAKTTQVNSNGYHPAHPHLPLSSMTSPPLDLNSVERRGQPTATPDTVKRKNRPHGGEEAPTYYPTEEEWRNPMEYLRKVVAEARQYGLCKLVPPESWNPPFAIDTQVRSSRLRPRNCFSWQARSGSLLLTLALAEIPFSNPQARIEFRRRQ